MRRWIIGAACAVAILATSPQGHAAEPEPWTGNWLLELHEADFSAFAGFVVGVAQTLAGLGAICGEEVTQKDAVDAVHLWLRLNRKELNEPAAIIVIQALKHHFPCDANSN